MLEKAASKALMLVGVALLGSDSYAQTGQAQFGLRLVIEPDCRSADSLERTSERVAAEVPDAIKIARRFLREKAHFRNLAGSDLTAEHDIADTGNWLIRARGIENPILRIEKCSGQVTPLIVA